MPLPTDALIKKAHTLTSNMAAIVPKLWAAQLENNLRKREVLQQVLVPNTDLLGTSGDIVYIPTLPDVSQADDLTEGTDMVPIALTDATSVPLTPSERGKAVSITRKALDRIKYDGMSAIIDRLAYAMSLKREGQVAALYDTVVPGTANKMLKLYPNGHTSANVVITDVFNAAFLDQAILQLKLTDNEPFDDGLWVLCISNHQYTQLTQDTAVRDDIHYSIPQVMLRGEVGIFRNCRIIVSNHIKETTNEGVGTNIKVSHGMLLAPRWAAVAWKRKDELGADPTVYDFGRRKQFGVTSDYDLQLIHHDRAIAVNTAHA